MKDVRFFSLMISINFIKSLMVSNDIIAFYCLIIFNTFPFVFSTTLYLFIFLFNFNYLHVKVYSRFSFNQFGEHQSSCVFCVVVHAAIFLFLFFCFLLFFISLLNCVDSVGARVRVGQKKICVSQNKNCVDKKKNCVGQT